MVRSRPSALALRLLLAACALLGGLDLHVLEFGAAPAAAAQPAAESAGAGAQVHDDDCQHREHLPPDHDAHDCTLCKASATSATGLLAHVLDHAQPPLVVARLAARSRHAPPALAAGLLGARGPPGPDA